MKPNDCPTTEKISSPDLPSAMSQSISQTNPKLIRRSSVSSTTSKQNLYNNTQRRQSLAVINNDFLIQHTSPSFSIPLLIDTMNTFFQTAQVMEEEIMLPSRLKDMPVEELVFDNSVQPDNWHEIYTFIRDMRNQLRCTHPFADDDDKTNSKDQQRKTLNDDEGIIVSTNDNNQFSSASSVSSDEYEQISTLSAVTSFDTIKDELILHYYGLFRTLDNLISLANRVTEKYREECVFKVSSEM